MKIKRFISEVKYFIVGKYYYFKYNGFKQGFLNLVWHFLTYLDKDKKYGYETAPYCGHYYSGINGKYIQTDYCESMGGGCTTFTIFGYKLYYSTEENKSYFVGK